MGRVLDFLTRTDHHQHNDDVPRMLRELADEWEHAPPGTGVLTVIVTKGNNYPDVRGYGDFGMPMIELELARMLLFKLFLGRNQ